MEHSYIRDFFVSTKGYTLRLFADQLFYIGGIILGSVYYLTGLSIEYLQSIMIITLLDIITRCWAEYKYKRRIVSRKMSFGFVGKMTTYLILFTFSNHAFGFGEVLTYIVLGGFSLVEGYSIIENLKDAGQAKYVKYIEAKLKQEEQRINGETDGTV